MKRTWLSIWRGEKGQTLAEAAWVLPVLTAMFLGIMIFGFLMYTKLVVIDSARDGARHYALGLGDPSTIVQTDISSGQLNPSNILSVTPNDMGDYVSVTVTYQQNTFVPGIGTLLGGSNLDSQTGCTSCIKLQHTATFKKES